MKQKLFSRSDIEAQFGSLSTAEGKKKLAEYALKHYGVKLVRNKSFENMMNDFEDAVTATTEKARSAVGDAVEQIDLDKKTDLSNFELLDGDNMDDDEEDSVAQEIVKPVVEHAQVEEHPPVVQDVSAVPLSSLPELKEKISDAIEQGTLHVGSPLPKSSLVVSFPEGYTPRYRLIGPEGRAFINIPHWVHDWIIGNPNWKAEISICKYDKELLKSLLFYIERDGSVAIRESRNSRFHTLQ